MHSRTGPVRQMAVIGQRGILSRSCNTQTEFNSAGMAQAYIFAGLLLKRLFDRIRPYPTVYAFRFEQHVGWLPRSAKITSARRVFIKYSSPERRSITARLSAPRESVWSGFQHPAYGKNDQCAFGPSYKKCPAGMQFPCRATLPLPARPHPAHAPSGSSARPLKSAWLAVRTASPCPLRRALERVLR